MAGTSGHVAPFARRFTARGSAVAVLPVRAGDESVLPAAEQYRLCSTTDELLEQSDVVLVLEDRHAGADHLELVRPLLQAGIPTFVDKPLMPDLATSTELFALAEQHGAVLMSSSSARYADPVERLRRVHQQAGLTSLTMTGTGELWFYGVHLAEMAVAILGTGFETAQSVRDDAGWTARLRHRTGTTVTFALEPAALVKEGFSLAARGPDTFEVSSLTDYGPWYDLLVDDVLTMARARAAPIDPLETLEVMRVLDAVERSAVLTTPATLTDG